MSNTSSFKDRIQRFEAAPGEVLVLPASISNVVAFYASFTNVPNFENGDDLLRDLVISMLDKGTRRHTKLEIAASIEDVGARLSFSSNRIHSSVSGKMLTDDLPDILQLMKEQLLEPAFPEDEFLRLRERYLASFQQSLLDTGIMSGTALNRSIFPADHPNYSTEPQRDIEKLQSIGIETVRDYYHEHFRIEDWRMAIVGDLTTSSLKESVLMDLPVSDGGGIKPWPNVLPGLAASDPININIPDRDNIDVKMGHAVGLKRKDEDYLPLLLGVFILGGNFSARLMQSVRDEKGLTYGVGSSLDGIAQYYSGQWMTSITLNTDKLTEGIEATKEELRKFVSSGVTEDEIREKKETIAGSFLVGLSTTGSLASAIVHTRERSDDLDYMDNFPEKIRAITLEQVNTVIKKHLDPDLLNIVHAGSLP